MKLFIFRASRGRSGWAGQWDRFTWPMPGQRPRRRRGRASISMTEWGLVVLAGLALGLAYGQFPDRDRAGSFEILPIAEVKPQPAKPLAYPEAWKESRKSADLLRGQEGRAPAEATDSGAGATAINAAQVRVVDGDTFWLAGEKIRIADIDTPEIRSQCAHEAQLAGRATARLQALLSAGPFELEPIGGRDEDRYGRKLRVVTRGGRSLGDQLVAEGLARTWSGRREPWCA